MTLKPQFVGKKIQKQPRDWDIGKLTLPNIYSRHSSYIDLACKSTILSEKLPPSERAVHYHGLRTHYQKMLWPLIDNLELKATDWGWKLDAEVITPVMTDKEIAPESSTKVI